MVRNTSLLSLPTELLHIIAKEFKFKDLEHFQESSAVVLAATSDVSFLLQINFRAGCFRTFSKSIKFLLDNHESS
jgi:hypothetical protein